MIAIQSIYQTYKRWHSLQTDRISSLPIVILMPHSSCNCRCVMCDIWKGNARRNQLREEDIRPLLASLKKLGTEQVLMSGGEALLNPSFFRLCELLKERKIRISLLSTGILLDKNAASIVRWVDDLILSLDGDPQLHDRIRDIPGAFRKMQEGIDSIRRLEPAFPIAARTVIHRLNFRSWPAIIETAHALGFDSISFLPADVSSQAFNRQLPWERDRQEEILIPESELGEMQRIIDCILESFEEDFSNRFILESPRRIQQIHDHYAAHHGLQPFPYKKCNAPWVSVVIEADGVVRPCFFHTAYGNINTASFENVLNGPQAMAFRKGLDIANNPTCRKCVCYLNLSPATHLV